MTFEVITPVREPMFYIVGNATGTLTSSNAPWEGDCYFILFVMLKVRLRALPKVTELWAQGRKAVSLSFTLGIFSLNSCSHVSLHDVEKSYWTFLSLYDCSGNVHLA